MRVGQWQGDVKDWHRVLVERAEPRRIHSVEDVQRVGVVHRHAELEIQKKFP